MSPTWTLVLPVRAGPFAKTRLGSPPGLAEAFVRDCADAVRGCLLVGRMLVVTGDPGTAADLRRDTGAETVLELRPGAGLLPALDDALRSLRPGAAATGPVGILLPDLPTLRAEDLTAALGAVQGALDGGATMVAVPDTEGTGTVLLAARSADGLTPAFGPDSLAAHVDRGAVPLALDIPRLRRDVDTGVELAAATRLGLGRHTLAALTTLWDDGELRDDDARSA